MWVIYLEIVGGARPGGLHPLVYLAEETQITQCRMRGTDSVNSGIAASKRVPSAATIW